MDLVTVDVTFQFVMAVTDREIEQKLLDDKAREYMSVALEEMNVETPAIITKFEGSHTVMDWEDHYPPYGQDGKQFSTIDILEIQAHEKFADLSQYEILDVTNFLTASPPIDWSILRTAGYHYVSIGGALFEYNSNGLTQHVHTINTTDGVSLKCKI